MPDPHIIDELILSRRSVKPAQFDPGKKVPDEVVRQAIFNATWAPTHGKTEPWHFIVFTGDGLKKLAEFQSELYKKDAGEKFTEAKYQKLISQPLLTSHMIAICMKRDVNSKIPEIEEVEAVACAVQNIYLTITAYGYGGYWTTGGPTYNENAKAFFGLQEQDKLLGFFCIGQVAIQPERGARKSIEEKSIWIR
ncbi:MAG: nitroreductase [Chitinophagaceae bacterium]